MSFNSSSRNMSFNSNSKRKLLARPGEYVADPDTQSNPSEDFMVDLGDTENMDDVPAIVPDYSAFSSSSGWRSLLGGAAEKAADPDSEGSQPSDDDNVVILPSVDGMVGGVFVPSDDPRGKSLEQMQRQLEEYPGSDTDDFATPQGSLRSGKSGSTGKYKFVAAPQTMEELEQMPVPTTVTKTNPRKGTREGAAASAEPPTPVKDNRSTSGGVSRREERGEESKNGKRNGIIMVVALALFFAIIVGIAISRNSRSDDDGTSPSEPDAIDPTAPTPTPTKDLLTPRPTLPAAFFSLAEFPGSRSLDEISDCDECEQTVQLPFALSWPGATNKISSVTVSTDGVIHLLGCGLLGTSCGEIRVVEADLDPSLNGEIWVATIPPTASVEVRQSDTSNEAQAYVVSWESIPFHDRSNTFVNAQATIYPEGNVLLCWGDGFPGVNFFSAGVLYPGIGVFVPPAIDVFDDDGKSIAGIWPANQCQYFDAPTSLPMSNEKFVPIGDNSEGQILKAVSDCDDCVETVELPFEFHWLGEYPVSQIVVTSDGRIGIDDCKPEDDSPCGEINVVSADLNPAVNGTVSVLYDQLDEEGLGSFLVSWEYIPFHTGLVSTFVNAQARLFPNGTIDICWGVAVVENNSFKAGIEDYFTSEVTPATGDQFDESGATQSGTWPFGQCQRFSYASFEETAIPTLPTNATIAPSNATEATAMPTDSPLRTPSPTSSGTIEQTQPDPQDTAGPTVAGTLPPVATSSPTPSPSSATPSPTNLATPMPTSNPSPKPSSATPNPTRGPTKAPFPAPTPSPVQVPISAPVQVPTPAPQVPIPVGVCAPTVGPCISTFQELQLIMLLPRSSETIAICGNDISAIEVTSQIKIEQDSTTLCCQGPGSCVLKSTGTDRNLLVTGSSVTLRDISFFDGVSDTDGGNVAITGGGEHKIIRCEFHDGRSTLNGGNLFVSDSSRVSIERSSFLRGDAAFGGGGVAVRDVVDFTTQDCVFEKNSATDGGGVIVSSAKLEPAMLQSVAITGAIFAENNAEVGGGLLLTNIWEGSEFILEQSSFFGNFASSEGPVGAIYHYSDDIEFSMAKNFGVGNLAPFDPNRCEGFSFYLGEAFCIGTNQNIRFSGGSRAPSEAPTSAPASIENQRRSIAR